MQVQPHWKKAFPSLVSYNRFVELMPWSRLRAAKVQEGEEPPEQPQALLEELNNLTNQLSDLIQKINRTNSSTMLDDNLSISDALA